MFWLTKDGEVEIQTVSFTLTAQLVGTVTVSDTCLSAALRLLAALPWNAASML